MFKKIPDTLVIVFSILVLITVLTWIIPAGSYDRVEQYGRTDIVVAGSYHHVESSPQGVWALLRAPFRGFVEAAKIIAFVLLVGGAFALVMARGAIDAGLMKLIRIAQLRKGAADFILVLLMLLFSLCGFTFGMSEESLVFVLITIPMARSMGYDTLVGVAIPFVMSGVGGSAAAYNPFSVGVAMEIAGLPFPSGVGVRTLLWAILTVISMAFILRYARRVKKNSARSLLAGLKVETKTEEVIPVPFNWPRIIVVALFLGTLAVIPFGAKDWDWGMIEIGAAFLAMGLLSALVMRMPSADVVRHFTEGARGMLTAALVICISRSVLVVARDGQIIDTILFHLSNSLSSLPKELSIQLMFVVQGIINFFIPSGSGQAAITMPVMAPLADLVDISRQNAVMAFQLAAGYFDLIIPTSGVTMGVLSLAGVPYQVWLRWMWKLMVWLIAAALVSLVILVNTDF